MHRLTRMSRRHALRGADGGVAGLDGADGAGVGAHRRARAGRAASAVAALSGTNQAQFWVADDSSRAATYLDRFDLQYDRGPWTVAGRLVFDEESRIDPSHFAGIKRRFVEYRGDLGALRAGTFYATFGRGLLLRAEEDDAVRLDRDIDGVLGSLAWRAIDGQAFVGRPRNDITYERDDLLSGAEFGVRPARGLRLGAGYVRQDADPADFAGEENNNDVLTAGSPVEELFGGNLQWSRGAVEAVFEGARRLVWGERDEVAGWRGVHDRDGQAYYGALTLGVPGYTLLIEGKDYRKFNAPYSTLPPANSAGTPINNGYDESGAGVMLTMSPTVDWLCQAAASYAEGDDDPGERTSAEGQRASRLGGTRQPQAGWRVHRGDRAAEPRLPALLRPDDRGDLLPDRDLVAHPARPRATVDQRSEQRPAQRRTTNSASISPSRSIPHAPRRSR